jgi:signal transduction histidine kinase
VLRIAQEALTNVRHHADATIVGVRLEVREGRASLRVADNGCGFDPRGVGGARYGLASMRERAALIGGRLEVRSAPGEGTTVELIAPLDGRGTGAAGERALSGAPGG